MTDQEIAAKIVELVGGEENSKPVYENKLQRAIRLFSDTFVPIICIFTCACLLVNNEKFWIFKYNRLSRFSFAGICRRNFCITS